MDGVRLQHLRADFPGSASHCYLNTAAHGLLSRPVRQALDRYLDALESGVAVEPEGAAESAREMVARLLHVTPDALAWTKNISEGMNILVQGFSWHPGDNVLVCPDFEHENLVYALRRLEARGVEVRCIDLRDGRLTPRDFAEHMDERTRLVAVSAVSFTAGTRLDVQTLGAMCRERDVFLLVDAAQAVGVLNVDLDALPIDGLVANSHKGLLGVRGLGILYCHPSWIDRIQPVFVAERSLDANARFQLGQSGAWPWKPGAQRFEIGHSNTLASVALLTSLQYLIDIGTPRIEEHTTALAEQFRSGLHLRGFQPQDATGLLPSSIVSLIPSSASTLERPGSAAAMRLVQRLQRVGVVVAARREFVRFSFHVYNTSADVEHTLAILAEMSERERSFA